mgnify:CR=1 FL=1
MSEQKIDGGKRTWIIASGCAGAVGAGFVAVPFVSSFRAFGACPRRRRPVEVDISAHQAGREAHRRVARQAGLDRAPHARSSSPSCPSSTAQLADPKSKRNADELTPTYARNEDRSHQARSTWSSSASAPISAARRATSSCPAPQPSLPDDWAGGFLCPCHGSTFDMAGRVFKDKPAPGQPARCRRTCTSPTAASSSAKTKQA